MRVLLLYIYPNHKRTMETMSSLLREHGIYNDVICVRNFDWIHNSDLHIIPLFKKLSKLQNTFRPYRFREKYISFFNQNIMKLLFSFYDKVDIHAFRFENLFWTRKCIDWKIKYDITLWGSEVLRASEQELLDVEWGYREANSIRGIENMFHRLSKVFEHKYEDKMIKTYFGNTNYNVINNVSIEKAYDIAKTLGIKLPDKYTLTCGYNGHPQQQHSIIIEALQQLPETGKQKIHVVIPMTYGFDESYYQEIKQKIDATGISYIILKRYLKPEELAALRITPDIVINTQTTDAFCGALQEHLYCKNIVIIGDWLEYPQYDDNDVFYIKASKDSLNRKIQYALDNIDLLKNKTFHNTPRLKNLTSWDTVMPTWVKAMKL